LTQFSLVRHELNEQHTTVSYYDGHRVVSYYAIVGENTTRNDEVAAAGVFCISGRSYTSLSWSFKW